MFNFKRVSSTCTRDLDAKTSKSINLSVETLPVRKILWARRNTPPPSHQCRCVLPIRDGVLECVDTTPRFLGVKVWTQIEVQRARVACESGGRGSPCAALVKGINPLQLGHEYVFLLFLNLWCLFSSLSLLVATAESRKSLASFFIPVIFSSCSAVGTWPPRRVGIVLRRSHRVHACGDRG
jgi:hypothetical protein